MVGNVSLQLIVVGMTGLEPAALCTPCTRSSQLSYIPIVMPLMVRGS